MIYNEYERTVDDVKFRVRYYIPSDIGYVLEISSSKAAEQTFVKFNLNLECAVTNFYGDSYTKTKQELKKEVKLNLTDFLKNQRFRLHRQIYEEAKQKLKEEIKK